MVGLSVDWRMARLPNGLRLITIARPGTPTVAVRAYVRAGSRYDAPPNGGADQLSSVEGPDGDPPTGEPDTLERGPLRPTRLPLGLAHFTEHLLFKGTRSHDQRELFAAVERLGGVLDAGTTKQYVTLCAVTPRDGLTAGVDVLAEILAEPALREEDFWEEKLVVLDEIRRAQDQQSVIFDLFAETIWQRHPLRYPIRGTLEGLHNLEPASLTSFYRQRYVTGNALLAVCGDIEHAEVRWLVEQRFASLPAGPEQAPLPVEERPLDEPRTAHLAKEVQLTSLLTGVPTVSMKHEDRSAIKVIERVLGMGGSARLYQHLREEARLVYSINTVTAHYEDVGYFAVHTVCDPQNLGAVQQAIFDEWNRLRREGVSADELEAAKSNYAGTQARRAETNLAVASIFGVQGLLHRVETFDEAVARIDAVRRDDVLRVARKYLSLDRYVTVTVGRQADT
jgi:predicted Zn-dependent peptidase